MVTEDGVIISNLKQDRSGWQLSPPININRKGEVMTNYTIDTKGKEFPVITGVDHFITVAFNDSQTSITFRARANFPLNNLDKEQTKEIINELMDDFDYAAYNFDSKDVCGLSDSDYGTIDWKLRSIVNGDDVLYRSGVTGSTDFIPDNDDVIKSILNQRTELISEYGIVTIEDNA